MENMEKQVQIDRINQHKYSLWKALCLFQGENDPNNEQQIKIKKEIHQKFTVLADDIQSATASAPPSVKILQNHRPILDAYVPQKKQDEFLALLDKYNQFPYSKGYSKRTVRSSKHWELYSHNLEELFQSYYHLSFYAENIYDYLKSSEKRQQLLDLLYPHSCPTISHMEDLITAELDADTTDLAKLLEEILLSENNTMILSTDIIRGIIKSSHTHLHKVLGDFLLTARLQESVRQAIFENMDCGTTEAFFTLLQVISENNLLCFSVVKRAVCTWTGLCDAKHFDYITNKQLELIKQSLFEKEFRQTLIQSNDSIELYIGLWAFGFFEIEEAISCCKELIANGTKNQKLVVSYYNLSLQDRKFAMQTASQILETYPQDIELCAAFLPTYMQYNFYYLLDQALYGSQDTYSNSRNHIYLYQPIPLDMFYLEPEQVRKHFYLWKEIFLLLPKKGYTYSPYIFPWYSISITPNQVALRMAVLAFMLQEEELIDQICPLLPEIEADYRDTFLHLFLHSPKNTLQKQTLIKSLIDKHSRTRLAAFELISNLKLEDKDFESITALLKYKNSDIRKKIISLLEKQNPSVLISSIRTLLTDKKEEMHLAGLDLLTRLKKDHTRREIYQACFTLLPCLTNPTEKESVILNELAPVSQTDSILNQKGYGLFDPDADFAMPVTESDPSFFLDLFQKTKLDSFNNKREEIDFLFKQLENLYLQNKDREYIDYLGYKRLLDNGYVAVTPDSEKDPLDCYPFPELWRTFYQEQIQTFPMLLNLYIFSVLSDNSGFNWTKYNFFLPLVKKIYGENYLDLYLNNKQPYLHWYSLQDIIKNLFLFYSKQEENTKLLTEAAYSLLALFRSLPLEETIHTVPMENDKPILYYALKTSWFDMFLSYPRNWKTDTEFIQMFLHFENTNQFYGKNILELNFFDYIKAYEQNIISLDNVYQAAFEKKRIGLYITFYQLIPIICFSETSNFKYSRYLKEGETVSENYIMQVAQEFYWNTLEMILKVELKRSETDTPFSYMIRRICKVRGISYLIEILTALGKDTLNRAVYYNYHISSNKNDCLSCLLSVSEPLPGENGETLKTLLSGKNISEKRLVEVAVYNPKWINCIEEYLGWSGLKSGIYYFMAHINEHFSNRTAAVIAKYTPLSIEDLNNGAFDRNWFLECSKQLGEAHFKILYDSAKYLSDTNKYTRVQKYTDAALGKITAEELETMIQKKRNKDTLMSYALIPIQNEKDILHRYQFLHQFLKESKQFGAQKRASEKIAVAMALKNLAINTGYDNVTRLTLNMESKLVKNCFQWQKAEELRLKIQLNEDGKPACICEKNGKLLKSIPAKYKNNPLVTELKKTCIQLQDQYSQTKAMMEQFMEYGVEMMVSEIRNLQKNPVIWSILKDLVYLCDKQTGFLNETTLINADGTCQKLTPKKKLRIAHPFDLWKLGIWSDYQKILFEKKIQQPFKQVFRELYVKTEEELECFHSLRYAGNQIQPKKTAVCLKSRHWVADYKNGLQKVYYKENIVARIYAIANWFSPSDTEFSTLEWVDFSDRKTFQCIRIKDVPDRIFSEVMRNVDLAVSVDHAGGIN